jgi:hypothetical protein
MGIFPRLFQSAFLILSYPTVKQTTKAVLLIDYLLRRLNLVTLLKVGIASIFNTLLKVLNLYKLSFLLNR